LNLTDLHRIRDAIADGLRVRLGFIITEEIVADRSNNITEYLHPIVDELTGEAYERGFVAGGAAFDKACGRREPWNERGSDTKSGSPGPESSGPVPAERLTSTEITKVSGPGVVSTAPVTREKK
jgi:hypothetical protein